MPRPIAKRFLISGRVQGVGFRAYVQKHASALGVKGYAKNLATGDVEVLAAGSLAAIEALRGCLRQGPTWAEVRSIEEHDAAAVGYDEFFIA